MVIPIADEAGRRHRFPFIMILILLANVAVFIYQISLPERQLEQFVLRYALIPYEVSHGVDLPPPAGPGVVYLTVFTSMFMHANWLHIGSNMLYLLIFGDNVEDRLGHLRFALFYLVCGVAAAMLQVMVIPDTRVPNVGASGAIAGVLGGYLVLFPRAAVRVLLFLGPFITTTRVAALLVILFWAGMQLLSGLAELAAANPLRETGGVAYWAHIGGFVAGFVLARFFAPGRR
jgi:membrane associated rhomboid family serine protease